MTHTISPELRELFYKEKCHYEDGTYFCVYENNPKDIADWWLAKLAEREVLAKEEERERLTEIIRNEKSNGRCSNHRVFQHGCSTCQFLLDTDGEIDRILSLLTQDNKHEI